ncbi:SRPBCC family protein [Actinomadura litoris]|uniref:SRPBCC family protein n=1 Tax=Actinomadura litoris TaxID=2678616 RepID=UPI001FA6D590|nr:SRPBCC family protein [Actinomadura litoris]
MFSDTSSRQQSQPRARRNRVRVTALTLSFATAGVLAGTVPAAQAAEKPSHGRAYQCRGEGLDPGARIRYRTDIMIKAPLSTVFKLQTDVERWPAWQPPVLTAKRLDHGRLRKGSRFHWTTPAPPTVPDTTMHITSTVRQLRNNACILWAGPAVGKGARIDEGVHLWTFTKVRGGVLVHTEETWTGRQVEEDVPGSTAMLGQGLEEWLRNLKATAEARH